MISARWTGLEEAIRNARALGDEMARSEVLEPALVAAAKPLRDEIVRTFPRSRDTEHMADTFIVIPSRADREEGRAVVLVGPSAAKGSDGWKVPFVEFGTSKMGARPTIRPAFDAFKGGFLGALVPHLQRRYAQVVRKYVRRSGR